MRIKIYRGKYESVNEVVEEWGLDEVQVIKVCTSCRDVKSRVA